MKKELKTADRNKLQKIIDNVKGGETYESIFDKLIAAGITRYASHDYLVTIGMWPETKILRKEAVKLLNFTNK